MDEQKYRYVRVACRPTMSVHIARIASDDGLLERKALCGYRLDRHAEWRVIESADAGAICRTCVRNREAAERREGV